MNPNQDRRKALRRKVIDGFAFYVQIPKIGTARHALDNVSELGIGFMVDSLGGTFSLQKDEILDVNFHLNSSLSLKLKAKVMRQEQKGEMQEVGALLVETQSKAYQTYLSLVRFLDNLVETEQSDSQ